MCTRVRTDADEVKDDHVRVEGAQDVHHAEAVTHGRLVGGQVEVDEPHHHRHGRRLDELRC